MRHGSRVVASILALVVMLGGLGSASARADENDGNTAPDKETIAREVTAKECQSMPNWDGIDFKVFKLKNPDLLNPRKTCEDVVYNQIMGTQSRTMFDQCATTLATLGGPLFRGADWAYGRMSGKGKWPLTEMCERNASKVFTKAKAALDKAMAEAKKVAGAVKCAVSEGLPCILRQFADMQGSFVKGLWDSFFHVLTRPSTASSVLSAFSTSPQERSPQQKAFAGVYRDVGWASASILLVVALVSLVAGAVQGHAGQLKSMLMGVGEWGVAWLGGITLAGMFLVLCDGLAVFFAGPAGPDGATPIQEAGKRISGFVSASVQTQMMGGSSGGVFASVVIGLVLLLAIGAALITLAFRDMSLVLMGVVLPLLLAMRAGPEAMRAALPRWLAAFAAAAMAKPLMVLGLRLGSAFIAEPGEGLSGLYTVALGTTMIVLVAFTPGVVYKLFAVMGTQSAGSSFGAGQPGGAQQSLHSARSMSTNSGRTQSVLASNAPVARSASGGSVSQLGAAGSSGKFAGGGGKMAGAVGALGAIGVGAMVAAETASTGVKVAASQVATAGGALGDAEKGHVAHPGYGSGKARGADPDGSGPSMPPRPSDQSQSRSSSSGSGGANGTPARQLTAASAPGRPVAPKPPQSSGGARRSLPPRTENPRKG